VSSSIDTSVSNLFIGVIIIFSFLFVNTWGLNIVEVCSNPDGTHCYPLFYELTANFTHFNESMLYLAEFFIILAWSLAIFQIILFYSFSTRVYFTEKDKIGTIQKYAPLGILVCIIISFLSQIWWMIELRTEYSSINPTFGYYFMLFLSVVAIIFAVIGLKNQSFLINDEDNLIFYEDKYGGRHR
jgi:hypothetical protein